MRVLVLFAHPDNESYGAALQRAVISGLARAGHEIDICNLYEENFDPVMNRDDRRGYYRIPDNRASVATYVQRLEAAEALVVVSPVWTLGFPAILKGYFDKVWLPGVAFSINNGRVARNLTNITKLAAVMTYGASKLQTALVGDPPRKVVTRLLRSQVSTKAKVQYFALYGVDRSTNASRQTFLRRIEEKMTRF